MYVRHTARGQGIARAVFDRLLMNARADGYAAVRLETLSFMAEAHALYRSVGAVETASFDGSEAVRVGLAAATMSMELKL